MSCRIRALHRRNGTAQGSAATAISILSRCAADFESPLRLFVCSFVRLFVRSFVRLFGYLLGLLAKIKCSICSYNCEKLYQGHCPCLFHINIFGQRIEVGACVLTHPRRVCAIALPAEDARTPLQRCQHLFTGNIHFSRKHHTHTTHTQPALNRNARTSDKHFCGILAHTFIVRTDRCHVRALS